MKSGCQSGNQVIEFFGLVDKVSISVHHSTPGQAVGSKELAKRGVLVTRLSAAEDAATMDVLCVDKTGTITMNQMAVTGVIPLERATEADVLFAGALASQVANQDPIDLAFLAAAKDRHVFDNLPKVTPDSFAPFDAKYRRTEAVVEQNGQRLRVMKGAVRTVAEACGLQPPAIEALEARVSESALKGYRTLAVARGPEEDKPGLVGLVTLYDPPRPDAKQLISELHDLGVRPALLNILHDRSQGRVVAKIAASKMTEEADCLGTTSRGLRVMRLSC